MGSTLETALAGSAPDMSVEIEIEPRLDLDACVLVVVCTFIATRVVAALRVVDAMRGLVTQRGFVVVRILDAARTGREHAGSLWRPAHVGRSASLTARAGVGAEVGAGAGVEAEVGAGSDDEDRLPAADAALVPAPTRWCTLTPRA